MASPSSSSSSSSLSSSGGWSVTLIERNVDGTVSDRIEIGSSSSVTRSTSDPGVAAHRTSNLSESKRRREEWSRQKRQLAKKERELEKEKRRLEEQELKRQQDLEKKRLAWSGAIDLSKEKALARQDHLNPPVPFPREHPASLALRRGLRALHSVAESVTVSIETLIRLSNAQIDEMVENPHFTGVETVRGLAILDLKLLRWEKRDPALKRNGHREYIQQKVEHLDKVKQHKPIKSSSLKNVINVGEWTDNVPKLLPEHIKAQLLDKAPKIKPTYFRKKVFRAFGPDLWLLTLKSELLKSAGVQDYTLRHRAYHCAIEVVDEESGKPAGGNSKSKSSSKPSRHSRVRRSMLEDDS